MKKIILTMRHLADTVLPLLFWVLLIFGFDTPDIAILTISAALIHELGHLAAIHLFCGSAKMRGHLSGFRIKTSSATYSQHALVLAAGPMANIALFLMLMPFSNLANGYVQLIAFINLLSALSNLLPIEGYDGYGILHTVASAKNSTLALRALTACSFSLCAAFTLMSLYLIMRYGSGYWIFGIFFLTLLGKIKKLFLP